MNRHPFVQLWKLSFGVLLAIGAARAGATSCTPLYNPAIPGELLGCCDASGTLRTSGACVDPTQSCRQGTCDGSGACGGTFSAVDGHPSCNNPNNPCLRGECYSKQCQGIDNGDGYASSCPVDTSNNAPCTIDCKPDTSTSFGLDVLCREGAANPPDFYEANCTNCCSIPNGTASCQVGNCTAGVCSANGSTINCTGTLGTCEQFKCISGGTCIITPKDPGNNCESPLNLEDCHDKLCVVNANGNGVCRDHGRALQGNDCEDGDGNRCTRGQCNSSFVCANVVGLGEGEPCPPLPGHTDADDNPCTDDVCHFIDQDNSVCNHPVDTSMNGQPCPSDNNPCTLDRCNASGTGACEHSQADPAGAGQPCTNVANTCHNAICVGATCTPQSCKNTGYCLGCSGQPTCNGVMPKCGCQ